MSSGVHNVQDRAQPQKLRRMGLIIKEEKIWTLCHSTSHWSPKAEQMLVFDCDGTAEAVNVGDAVVVCVVLGVGVELSETVGVGVGVLVDDAVALCVGVYDCPKQTLFAAVVSHSSARLVSLGSLVGAFGTYIRYMGMRRRPRKRRWI